MYFKNYEYFLMIAEEGSISKAADKLYLTQPSLSKYLKRLGGKPGCGALLPGSLSTGIDASRYYLQALCRGNPRKGTAAPAGIFRISGRTFRPRDPGPDRMAQQRHAAGPVSLLSRAVSSYHPVRKGRFPSADALLAGTRTGRSGSDALSQ